MYVLTSSAASNSFTSDATKKIKGAKVLSLKNGVPDEITSKDICIMLTPSTRNDYQTAFNLAKSGEAAAVVIFNAFAKVNTDSCIGNCEQFFLYKKPLISDFLSINKLQ